MTYIYIYIYINFMYIYKLYIYVYIYIYIYINFKFGSAYISWDVVRLLHVTHWIFLPSLMHSSVLFWKFFMHTVSKLLKFEGVRTFMIVHISFLQHHVDVSEDSDSSSQRVNSFLSLTTFFALMIIKIK